MSSTWIVPGELVIRTWNSKQPRWYPSTKPKAIDVTNSFGRVLCAHFQMFKDADETGRRVITLWLYRAGGIAQTQQPGTTPFQVQLEPGGLPREQRGHERMNARFHALLVSLSGSETVARQIERASALPFASPGALALPPNPDPGRQQVLVVAQDQHRRVVEAIIQREGGRAEAIMREHSRISTRNLALVARAHPLLRLLPDDSEFLEPQN